MANENEHQEDQEEQGDGIELLRAELRAVSDVQRQTLDELRELAELVRAVTPAALNAWQRTAPSSPSSTQPSPPLSAVIGEGVQRSQPSAIVHLTGAPKRGYVRTETGARRVIDSKRVTIRVPIGRTWIDVEAAGFRPRRIELETAPHDELDVDGTLEKA